MYPTYFHGSLNETDCKTVSILRVLSAKNLADIPAHGQVFEWRNGMQDWNPYLKTKGKSCN